MNFLEIDAARERAGIRRYALAKAAGVSHSHYWALRKRKHRALPRTLRRLEEALGELTGVPTERRAQKPEPARDVMVGRVYRTCLMQIAVALKFDPEKVLEEGAVPVPGARAFWKVRALAMWCANGLFGFTASELARALGTSKQVVHWNIRKAADLPETDAKIAAIAGLFDRLAPLISAEAGDFSAKE